MRKAEFRFLHAMGDSVCTYTGPIRMDNGETILLAAMHGHFVKLSNGHLALIYVMRQDIAPDGLHYASCRRACGALVNSDHGLSWDLAREYRLHELDFATGSEGNHIPRRGEIQSVHRIALPEVVDM